MRRFSNACDMHAHLEIMNHSFSYRAKYAEFIFEESLSICIGDIFQKQSIEMGRFRRSEFP